MSKTNIDEALRRTLGSSEAPGPALDERVKAMMKERIHMSKKKRIPLRLVVVAAVVLLLSSAAVYAAVKFLTPGQVAGRFGREALTKAFDSADSITVNKTVSSGGYDITLLGVAFGRDLTGVYDGAERDKTYAVIAIEKPGEDMPDTSSDAYGTQEFFVSPLIKGYAPWRVNIFMMSGGSGTFVLDGVMYRLVECDSVEAFAGTGVYIGVSGNNGTFCDNQSFVFDNDSGEIRPNSESGYVSVVFELPMDKSKADEGKAEALLKSWDIFSDAPEETAAWINEETTGTYLIPINED